MAGNVASAAKFIGTINKAWAAAIAAPLADWIVGIGVDALYNAWKIVTPDTAHTALVSLIVGVVVYWVPNLDPASSDQ